MSTSQNHRAAERLLSRPARPGELVVGDRVTPQWTDQGARFRYAVDNGAASASYGSTRRPAPASPPSTTPASPPP